MKYPKIELGLLVQYRKHESPSLVGKVRQVSGIEDGLVELIDPDLASKQIMNVEALEDFWSVYEPVFERTPDAETANTVVDNRQYVHVPAATLLQWYRSTTGEEPLAIETCQELTAAILRVYGPSIVYRYVPPQDEDEQSEEYREALDQYTPNEEPGR